ncbi:Rrf2 family transcriptional regulator [Clostridioides difficile]|nr:Rrf2 family transcriptional regulator [Clostridioides difficile]
MKLSTKGRYGLKAMFELALNQDNGPVSLKFIAKKQNIRSVLRTNIFIFKKIGSSKSVRGAQGGYLLSKNAEDITVGDILVVLEGPVALSDCVLDEDVCENSNMCVTKIVWEKMKKGIEDVIDSITLKDMINDYNKIN